MLNTVGNDRQNQDLGEDENQGYNNDDDGQRSNHSDDDNQGNSRGRPIDHMLAYQRNTFRSLGVVVDEVAFDGAVVSGCSYSPVGHTEVRIRFRSRTLSARWTILR